MTIRESNSLDQSTQVIGKPQPPQSPASKDFASYTYNWDTVFAIQMNTVNDAIRKAHSSPSKFTEDLYEQGEKISASGHFGDWQVAEGGDGKNLRMLVPLTASTIRLGKEKEYDLGAVDLIIEIKLHFLPHTEFQGSANSTAVKLVPKAISENENDPVVFVSGIQFRNDPGIIHSAAFEAVFSQWINSNLSEFNHIFAVVELNEHIDSDAQWAFTTPSYTSYGCLSRGSLEKSIFAVLCMTGGRSGEGNSQQISPSAVAEGHTSSFLVSQKRFLLDLVRPAMKMAYAGLSEENLVLQTNGRTLSLKDGQAVKLSDVEHDGKTYNPTLEKLDITAEGEELQIQSKTSTEVSPGITSITTATHFYNIHLATKKDGQQTLDFSESQPAEITHESHKSKGVIISQVIIGVLAAVAVVIAGILTDGAALVAASAVIGLVAGMAAATPSIIALAGQDDAPDIDALIVNATAPIHWPHSSGFKLNSAGLNVSLRLGGDLHVA